MSTGVIVLLVIGGIVTIFFAYGLSLPNRWEVRVTKEIPTDRETLYDYLNTIRNWEEWTIWNNHSEKNFSFDYDGPESGHGACQHWKAKRQFGQTRICGGKRPEIIIYKFAFGHGHHQMKGKLELEARDGGVELAWSAHGEAGFNPAKRIMANMFKPYMQKDFECGLNRLHKIFEDKA